MAIASPRATSRNFRVAPPTFYGDLDAILNRGDPKDVGQVIINAKLALQEIIEWQRLTVEVVNNMMAGRHNAHGTVTLTASQATTTLSDRRISAKTKVFLTATTANAAAEVGAGGLYQTFPNVTAGAAVLNHASNAQTDRDFVYVLAG